MSETRPPRTPSPAAAGPDSADQSAPQRPGRFVRWVPLAYAVVGTLWILASDLALEFLLAGLPWSATEAQILKGLAFIAITAGSLYLLMRHYAARLAASARKEAAARRKLADYAEAATDWLWEMDRDMRITAVSGRFAEITGDDPSALRGMSRDDLVAAAATDSTPARRLKARRPFRDLVHSYTSQAGRRFHFRLSGKPVFGPDGAFAGYRGTGSDVTAELEARAARDRLAAIVEESPDFVGTAEIDGRIRYINSGGRAMLGLGRDEDVTGLRPIDLRPPDAARHFEDVIVPAAVRDDRWRGRTEFLTRDGRRITVAQTTLAHRDIGGRVAFISTVARDLTEELRYEERLRLAQRMDALGQLTGGVAHDFNNLLVVILGNAEMLLNRLEGDSHARTQAATILDAAERGADLTHRLLSFSRQQSLRAERIELPRLIDSLRRLLTRTLGADIALHTDHEEGLRPVHADRSELETALINLAVNARDAMPEGGRLTITMANAPPQVAAPAADAAQRRPAGDCVVLSVSDTGTGIAPEIVERVFEPFFTTKEQGKGNGLGLAMVYGFARQSGGHVEIDSTPGAGTTVRLVLPAAQAEDDAGAGPAAEGAPGGESGGGETILVVEDDAAVRDNLVVQLRGLGYRVLEAGDGAAGLAVLGRAGHVDLLLSDMVMPGGMSGLDLAQRARRRAPGIRVLFTTGYADGSRLGPSENRAERDTSILHKPYRRAKLAETVRRVLDTPAP
ncbi:hybrid sensor histidine kinase/response regulator [Rhodobacteraceae bacterium WD3A24]|nr:hybrid sensor histidine kinase/response regulator [Rhodobacteraceae bacterium WD3A24]